MKKRIPKTNNAGQVKKVLTIDEICADLNRFKPSSAIIEQMLGAKKFKEFVAQYIDFRKNKRRILKPKPQDSEAFFKYVNGKIDIEEFGKLINSSAQANTFLKLGRLYEYHKNNTK